MTSLSPRTPEEVSAAVLSSRRLLPVGARTKAPLSRVPADADELSLCRLAGIREYEPAEFTLTALAGTPIAEVSAALAEQGQFLPFDPPLVDRGATIAGAVASGISGSGRQRYGGLRDFLIGVTLVAGDGRRIRGGGKVVKNAAGFDLPKLMVGSLGTLGVLVDLTFKVFPRPTSRTTLRFEVGGLAEAHAKVLDLGAAPLELDALDLERSEGSWRLLVRLAGDEASFTARARRVENLVGIPAERLDGGLDEGVWSRVRETTWVAPDRDLVRVPVSPTRVRDLEADLDTHCSEAASERRYSAGCAVLWLAWPRARGLADLELLLTRHRLAGQLVTGEAQVSLLGLPAGRSFYRRVKQALDPQGRFPDLSERARVGEAV